MQTRDRPESSGPLEGSDRRGFLRRLAALTLGSIAALIPPSLGLYSFLAPWRRRQGPSAEFVKVAVLGALPADGVPRRFAVSGSQVNAWNQLPEARLGAVYLRRMQDTQVSALNVVCPHAGCHVDYVAARQGFLCPCHNSTFALNGAVRDPRSPSPRGLDELPVEIRNGGEIWVRFQNFRPGTARRTPA